MAEQIWRSASRGGGGEGEHTLEITTFYPYGATGRDEVSFTVIRPSNTPPDCEILSPSPGAEFPDDVQIDLSAQVNDLED